MLSLDFPVRIADSRRNAGQDARRVTRLQQLSQGLCLSWLQVARGHAPAAALQQRGVGAGDPLGGC